MNFEEQNLMASMALISPIVSPAMFQNICECNPDLNEGIVRQWFGAAKLITPTTTEETAITMLEHQHLILFHFAVQWASINRGASVFIYNQVAQLKAMGQFGWWQKGKISLADGKAMAIADTSAGTIKSAVKFLLNPEKTNRQKVGMLAGSNELLFENAVDLHRLRQNLTAAFLKTELPNEPLAEEEVKMIRSAFHIA